MEGRQLVLWSGGWDSTLIAIQKLKESSEINPVHLIAFNNSSFGKEQQELESKARKLMLKEFDKKGWHYVYEELPMTTLFGMGGGLTQQPLNISLLAFAAQENDTCSVGIIRGDDYWQHSGKIANIFNCICETKQVYNVKLELPLKVDKKYEILESVKNEGFDRFVVTCDEPIKGKECGKCEKCLVVKMSKYELKLRNLKTDKNKSVEEVDE